MKGGVVVAHTKSERSIDARWGFTWRVQFTFGNEAQAQAQVQAQAHTHTLGVNMAKPTALIAASLIEFLHVDDDVMLVENALRAVLALR